MSKQTEIQVQLSGVHLCCQGCVNAVESAMKNVEGAESQCDMENGTVTLMANDDTAVQKALDAIAAAGFYGSSTGNKQLTMKAVSSIPHGKVKRLNVSGIHNCCDLCCEAIEKAIATVAGVTGYTVKPGATTFEVIGDFDALALVTAINAAGFSARVKQ